MSNLSKVIIGILAVGLILASIKFAPDITGKFNNWRLKIQKVDDKTNYETIKKVENTCRAMISSYNSDKLRYEQYKDSEDRQERNWGEEAKMRANTTASNYNNYILKNSFLREENIPSDIYRELEYLEYLE